MIKNYYLLSIIDSYQPCKDVEKRKVSLFDLAEILKY